MIFCGVSIDDISDPGTVSVELFENPICTADIFRKAALSAVPAVFVDLQGFLLTSPHVLIVSEQSWFQFVVTSFHSEKNRICTKALTNRIWI